jgi:hypothetical protein
MKPRAQLWIAGAVMILIAATAASAAHQTTLAAEIAKKATLADGGRTVLLTMRATCPAGATILEAFAYVTQDGNESQWGSLPVVCDSTPHGFVVRVDAFDPRFHRGEAQASAYVLLESGESISPTRIVKLKT